MEKLELRLQSLTKALKTLNKSLEKMKSGNYDDYEELRDSIIQRFEYSADTFWKFLKDYLKSNLKIEVAFARPKVVFKEALETKLITTEEHKKLINLIEDRNLTSHGYNEDVAEEISHNIFEYYDVMNSILTRLTLKINN